MSTEQNTLHIVAGPNGSGKTTFAESYFLKTHNLPVFLNPDVIASGIAPLNSESASFSAGRILLTEIKRRFDQRESFSFESTFSGKTWAPFLREAQSGGYRIVVYFLLLDSVQRNVTRVRERVLLGGHSIPKEAILRRHPRCFVNFWNLYRPLCSDWYVFNNSTNRPVPIQDKTRYDKLSNLERKKFARHFLKGMT